MTYTHEWSLRNLIEYCDAPEFEDGGLFAAAAMQVVHGDVQVGFAAGRLDSQQHGSAHFTLMA